MPSKTPDINQLNELREKIVGAAAYSERLTAEAGTPIHVTIPVRSTTLSALLDVAEAAHRSVEAWAKMQRPAHPDSAVPFMEMLRAVDDMDLGLNRVDTSLTSNEENR